MNTAFKVNDNWIIVEDAPLRNLKEEVRFALVNSITESITPNLTQKCNKRNQKNSAISDT